MKGMLSWGKVGTIAVVLVLALMAGNVAAVAAPGDLATRGDFAALLAEKAGIPAGEVSALPADVSADASYAGALAGLVKAGVMAGYPDGTMRPDAPVTGVQAAVMAGRALGLPSNLNVQGAGLTILPDGHWAYEQVAWMSEYGLIGEENLTEPLTLVAAGDFLNRVFGADQKAKDIVLKSMEAQKNIKAFSLEGTMTMNIVPRPGVSQEVAQSLQGMTSAVKMDFVRPDRMRQVITMNVPVLGDMAIEQYLIDSKMYQKLVNPETGEVMWQYMNLPFDFEKLMELQTPGIQEPMLEKFNYKYLGTTTLNGREVHKIGYYGRINDLTELGQMMSQAVGDDAAVGQLMAQTAELIKSMSLWGISYVGVADSLTYGDKTGALIGYADAMPIATTEMAMEISKYSYDPNITVDLPEEAKNAVEIQLPPMN